MPDEAHIWTDEQIEKLQKKFAKIYRQASNEMKEKLGKHLADFDKTNQKWKKRVKDDPSLESKYRDWLAGRAADKKWIRSMVTGLVQDAVRADQMAADVIYDAIPYVVAENANRAAWAIQEGLNRQIDAFTLYDADTIRYLIAEEPDLLPPIPDPEHDKAKDTKWNSEKFTNAITQSVLQGESIPHAAQRIMQVVGMDTRAATRAARTALTGAENAGRIQSYKRAKDLGIDLEQQWIATLDERTRIEHRLLDKQHVPVGEEFKVPGTKFSIEFPGDPTADPSLVWNCRCTLVAYFSDVKDPDRWANLPKGMTYDQWKESAPKYGKTNSKSRKKDKNKIRRRRQ